MSARVGGYVLRVTDEEEADMASLDGKTIAFLVAPEGVEQVELTEPWKAVEEAGGTPELVSTEAGQVQAFNHLDKADTFPVDRRADADASTFDGLVLPGGVANPDACGWTSDAVGFVQEFFEAGKPVAAICHAPWTLIEADVVRGRTVTSWPSLQHRPAQRGRRVGRRGGVRRRQPRHQPQARRPPRLQREARESADMTRRWDLRVKMSP